MKVAFVTMRYGTDVVGGAEAFCRIFAEHLSEKWEVEVLTTDAKDFYTWRQPAYKTGTDTVNGVSVLRFSVTKDLDPFRIGDISRKYTLETLTHEEEVEWIDTHGPISPTLFKYIEQHKDDYDIFIFWGYLWAHTYYGMQPVAKKSIIIPFIHDEPCFYFNVYKSMFESAAGMIFQTPEEKNLLLKTLSKAASIHEVAGIHVDHPKNPKAIALQERYKVNDPYIVYVGRIEPAKGVYDLIDMFHTYKKNNPGNLKLVLVGNTNNDLATSEDIIKMGPIFGDEKFAVISHAKVLINPSAFESFSLVLAEAWYSGVPVLVNEKCAVLVGQCKRSNGGLWYSNVREFDGMLNVLLENEILCKQMAINGREYLDANYSWEAIDAKYEAVAKKIIQNNRKRS